MEYFLSFANIDHSVVRYVGTTCMLIRNLYDAVGFWECDERRIRPAQAVRLIAHSIIKLKIMSTT